MEEVEKKFRICSIEEAIDYENNAIIDHFTEQFDISIDEAKDIFLETKKWLWLCAKSRVERVSGNKNIPERLEILETQLMLDEMWHTFILFTVYYTEYCETRFGSYIHHHPLTKSERIKIKKEFEDERDTALKKREDQLKQLYGFVYDNLGEDTLNKWYSEMPSKYSPDRIALLRKK